MFGAAAVALIQSQDIKPCRECVLCHAQYGARFARTFEAVDNNQGWMSPWQCLPVTFPRYLSPRLNFKQPPGCMRQNKQVPRPILSSPPSSSADSSAMDAPQTLSSEGA